MIAMAVSPWGKMPLAHGRTGAARLACAGAGETSPGGRSAARPEAEVSSRGVPASTAAPVADSHIATGAAFSSASRAEGAEPRPAAELSEPALMVLQLIAAHHGCGVARAVELAAFAYADEIGLPALLDARQDIAAVPPFERRGQNRFSHTCESEPGRQEVPLGLLPMPHAPP